MTSDISAISVYYSNIQRFQSVAVVSQRRSAAGVADRLTPVVRHRLPAERRIIGSGDLWITEYIPTYDGRPSYTVSIMEFSGDKVVRETQYFADPFEASTWRAQWVERMGEGELPSAT